MGSMPAVTTLALWSAVLKPGQKFELQPQADLRITNVALGDKLEDANGRTSVKLTYESILSEDDENITGILCSLTPGKIEQATIDLVLDTNTGYVFESVGKNTVHLFGNYIDQGHDQSDVSDDEDEEDFDLREVSSDVEMELDPAEIDSDASRFEEVDDEEGGASKSLKRPRESTEGDGAEKTSKAEKKKPKKKAKAEDGSAVPVITPESSKKPESSAKKPEGEKKDEKKEKKDKLAGQEKEVAGGVKIKDTTVGEGPMAKKGNKVGMRYIGKLPNGKVFDKNVKGKPFNFVLGGGEVIKGWDEGIVGMQAGGERVLTIPPAMGYGKRGSPPEIPPNSTLIFEVKLLKIKK